MKIKIFTIEGTGGEVFVCSDTQLKRLEGDEREEAKEALKELLALLPPEGQRQSTAYEMRKYTAGELLQAKSDYMIREKGYTYYDFDRINPRLLAGCIGRSLEEVEGYDNRLMSLLIQEMEMLSNPNPFALIQAKEKSAKTLPKKS